MNPTNKTWQDRAREYLEAKKNVAYDQKSLEKLREGLEWTDTSGLTEEERRLLNKVFE